MVKQIPNGYKQTKVGIIPENWQVIKINEILKIGSGKDYKHLNNGNIPVYGTGGYMLSVDKFLYEGDSVCIGRKGTIDKPMFLTDKFWTVDTLFYTHSFRNTIPKFIYFTFQSIDWLKYNEASGVPSLSKSTIELIQIPLPPIKEQEKIAEILSTWDNAITKQEQLIEQKKVFKKSIMQQIFSQKVRFKDENGKEYPVYEQKRLGEICEINKGEQLSKHNMLSSGEYPVLNGGITYSGYINKFNTNENTITISEGGNSCGFVNFISNKFWAGGHCYVLKKVTLSELYLYYILKYNELNIMKLRVGSGLPNIQKTILSLFIIKLPSLPEQIKIANFLNWVDAEIIKHIEVINNLKRQRKSLMQKLLTGEIRVKYEC